MRQSMGQMILPISIIQSLKRLFVLFTQKKAESLKLYNIQVQDPPIITILVVQSSKLILFIQFCWYMLVVYIWLSKIA